MSTAVEFGRFRVVPHRRELLADNLPVELGARAFDVLMALIEARGAVVSKDALMARVWPDRIVEENNLAIHVLALRKAFAADRDLIRTVFGRGYQFTGEIRTVSAGADVEKTPVASQMTSPPSRPPTNLPEPVSELIGRDAQLGEILALSRSQRLVTLAGAGGIGKTRLAFEVARLQLPRFADGVWAIELAPLSDPDLVPVTVATALGLVLASGMASPQSVANALRTRQIMLVLDNCEHVIDAAARMAEALLRVNPAARVIATSREPLRAEGERVHLVPPLGVPPEGNPDGEDTLRYGAVRLFAERVRDAAADFSPDASVAAAIAGICCRLDGIPLAIELAAARAASLGIEGLAAGLEDRFRLLTTGRRTALPRHQTLRGTLDWSYELLTGPERAVLRRLAIFAGGCTLQAASAVVADDEITVEDVHDCVASLVSKSLVAVDVGGPMRRYRLLETTRAYALEKLRQSGEYDMVALRHATLYRDLFVSAEAETRPTAEWLADHVPRIDNLRAALDWAFSPSGDASIGVTLTAAAVPLWMHLSLLEECRGRVEVALAAGVGRDARREMQLYSALATSLMHTKGAVPEIGEAETKALKIAESLDDSEYQLRSLWGLWAFRIADGQHSAALSVAQRFHALAVKRSNLQDTLVGERMMGNSRFYLGELLIARRHLERVLDHHAASVQKAQVIRFHIDQWASVQAFLARVLWLQGLPDQAMRAAENSVADARATNHAVSLADSLAIAACPIALWSGDLGTAERYVEMLLDHSTRHVLRRWSIFGRFYQAMLVIYRGDVNTGLRLLRAVFAEPVAIGNTPRLTTLLVSAASGHVGQIVDGLSALKEAIVRSEFTEERWLNAELLRVKGEYSLSRNPAGAAAAEDHFREALDLAHRQGALAWELRAATSLARLWHDQARNKEALELLAPVYDRYTEGFATADLKEAKRLLEELA